MGISTILDQMTNDLTSLAQQGRIDPLFGRDTEISQLIEVLCHPENNAAVLIGDEDVGLTAIVEAIAQCIADGRVPNNLLNRHIRQLDIVSLIIGLMHQTEEYRDNFVTQRLNRLIPELSQTNSVLFFTGYFHVTDPIANKPFIRYTEVLLKAAVEERKFLCIRQMTALELGAWQVENPILSKHFQSIYVYEPSLENAIQMIRAWKSAYEEFHHAHIPDDVVEAAVLLSAKFVPDRVLPAKAIELIDEAAARLRASAKTKSEDVHVSTQNIAEVVALWTGLSMDEILGT